MVGALAACLLPSPAQAQQAVIDASSIAKIQEQIKQAKEDFANQIEQLKTATDTLKEVNEVREGVEEIGSAVGEVASFKIPFPNIDKMRARFQSDIACMIPNKPGYGFLLDEWTQASFCDLAVKYRESLFSNVEDWSGLSWFEQEKKRQELEKNRQSLLADTAVQTLSKADVIISQAETVHKGINDIETAASSAETLQEKQARTNDLLVTLNRQQADTNVLLAHMAKTQTAMFIKLGLKFQDLQSKTEDKE